jgi:hypothetical protein
VSIASYNRKHTDVFGEPLAKWLKNCQVCGTCALGHVQRVLHTLTALPRDAIDLPGHVTEDDMRPIPTETSSRHHSIFHRLAMASRQLAPKPCDIALWQAARRQRIFLNAFSETRPSDLHLTISGGQCSVPVFRFSDWSFSPVSCHPHGLNNGNECPRH